MNWKLLAKSLIAGAFFAFLLKAFFTFLIELWTRQQELNELWAAFSVEQRVLESQVLALMDLNLMLSALCLILYIKLLKELF